MVVNLSGSSSMGIPMMFPISWEENVAANMTRIPLLELFPGVMVSNLYKSYREGLAVDKYLPWDPNNPSDQCVGYISDTTRIRADVVRDFLDSMVRTIAAGKAPANILTGQASTGLTEKIPDVVTAAAPALKSGMTVLKFAVVGVVAVAGVYLLSMARPFLKRG